MTKRVVSLFLPSWSTDRLRRTMGANAPSLDAPLVLIGHEGRRRVVLAADQAARREGLKPGMAATKAQALIANLIVMDADPDADGWRWKSSRSGCSGTIRPSSRQIPTA